MQPPRSETDIENDFWELDRFLTMMKVFALHGRSNGLERDECAALLSLVFLAMDPVCRLMKDHNVRGGP